MKKITPKMPAKKKTIVNANKGFDEELKFALKFIEDDNTIIEEAPYYHSYFHTVKKEVGYMKEDGVTLVIGTGPVPLTLILLQESYTNYGVKLNGVYGIDSSRKAVALGQYIVEGLFEGREDGPSIYEQPGEEASIVWYDNILVTLEAGSSSASKNKLLKHLAEKADSDAVIIVRSSNTDDFVNCKRMIKKLFTIVDRVDIFDGLSTSFILKKK